MLYYQMRVSFRFTPGKKSADDDEEEMIATLGEREIHRINNQLRRAFAPLSHSAIKDFAAACALEKDSVIVVAGLQACNMAQVKQVVTETFQNNEYLDRIRISEIREISSQKLLADYIEAAYDTDMLGKRPNQFEAWDNDMDTDAFSLKSGLCSAEKLTLNQALAQAETLMLDDQFLQEIRRIYDPANMHTFVEHPAHYRVTIGSEACVEPAVELLVRCLYSTGRLQGVRYDILKKITDYHNADDMLDQLFLPSAGVTVAISLSDLAEEDENGFYGASNNNMLDTLAERIKKHYKQTLFIFLERHPHEAACNRLISSVDDVLSIVELGEGRRPLAQAQKYLDSLIAASDRAQYARPEDVEFPEQDGYTASEVQKIYDNWSKKVLRERIYPAYQQELADKPLPQDKPKATRRELMDMVGLTEAKAVINDMIAAAKLQNLRKSWGIKDPTASRHMLFTGNPGSAKTTVARIVAKILAEEEIISEYKLVECGRANLVGKYVGHTAPLVRRKFKEAKGGVLFIDEAYALVEDHHSYGDEAINTIVQEMENRRDDVIVILAGYPDKMAEFLEKNEGLKSRIAFHVNFPDYTIEELSQILARMCRQRGYELTEAAKEKCSEIFTTAIQEADYGNGRFVRNLLEQATLRQAKRLLDVGGKISEEQGRLLEAEDFEQLALNQPVRKGIGFHFASYRRKPFWREK